jgi:hypothetical protein
LYRKAVLVANRKEEAQIRVDTVPRGVDRMSLDGVRDAGLAAVRERLMFGTCLSESKGSFLKSCGIASQLTD